MDNYLVEIFMMMNHSIRFSHGVLFPLCGVCLLLVLPGALTAHGATYYVASTGNDGNPGNLSQPFKTFGRAVEPLHPGDTLYIREDTWTQQLDLMANNISGTAGAYIRIAGYPGETVKIQYADPTTNGYGPIKARGERGYLIFENLVLDGSNGKDQSGWQIRDGNHHFLLRKLEIKNFKHHGLFIKANDIEVNNCTIHDQLSVSGGVGERWSGIYVSDGSNVLIEGNEIYNNPGGGIHVYPTVYPGTISNPISSLVIRGNSVYKNNALPASNLGGILLFGTSSSIISSALIYNNLVYNNGTSSSGDANGILLASHTNETKVWNNTVYGNKTWGLRIGHDCCVTNTVVQNNIIYGNGTGDYKDVGSGTTSTKNLTTDPKFINASARDFRIQSNSEAIDAGITLNQVRTDIRNVVRPRGRAYDIGAYEYEGDVSAPPAPTNMIVR